MNNNTSNMENKQLSTLEEISVQAFINILNGPNLNTSVLPDLLETCNKLSEDVDIMSDEIDEYIRDKVGHIDGSITNQDHPLLVEYRKEISKLLDLGPSYSKNYPLYHGDFSRYRVMSLSINNLTGQEVKNIITSKVN